MLPLIDLLNHGDPESRNLEVMRVDNGSFIAYALRDIKQGEHVSQLFLACRDSLFTYQHLHAQRWTSCPYMLICLEEC